MEKITKQDIRNIMGIKIGTITEFDDGSSVARNANGTLAGRYNNGITRNQFGQKVSTGNTLSNTFSNSESTFDKAFNSMRKK